MKWLPDVNRPRTWRLETWLPTKEPVESPVRRRRGEAGPLRWRKLLDDGVYATRAELARAEGVSRAAVTQGLGRLSS
jgi:hypothetical protein